MPEDKHTIQVEIDPVVNAKNLKDKVEAELKELKAIQAKLELQIGPKQTLKQTLANQIKEKQSQVKLANKEYESGLKIQEKQARFKQISEAREKKAREAKEKKHYNLREKVEKYRLSETKKLMKQGMSFEKARKTAFTKSLMSAKDLRALEYKELQENKKQAKKGSLASAMLKASFLGNLGASAATKGMSSIFGFIMESIFKKAEDARSRRAVAVTYDKKEQARIKEALATKTRQHAFATEKEQLDFMKATAGFKAEMMGIRGLTGIQKYQRQALELTADLVGRYVTDLGTASQAVQSAIRGDFADLFNVVKVAIGNEKKLSTEQLEYFSNMQVHDPLARFKKIEEILRMVQNINKAGASQFDQAGASFRRLLDQIQTLIATSAEPVLKGIKMLIDFISNPIENTTKFFTSMFDNLTSSISQTLASAFSTIKSIAESLNPFNWFKKKSPTTEEAAATPEGEKK